jgi:hypothetical protein
MDRRVKYDVKFELMSKEENKKDQLYINHFFFSFQILDYHIDVACYFFLGFF